jgi:hypothetical protein
VKGMVEEKYNRRQGKRIGDNKMERRKKQNGREEERMKWK